MTGDDSEDSITKALNALRESYTAEPDPVPLPAFRYADPSYYDVALPPKAALCKFPYDEDTAIIQLRRELDVARVTGIAEHAVWQDNNQVNQSYYLIVPTWFWSMDTPRGLDFWDTGFLERFLPVKGYSYDANRWIKLFQIRFFFPGDLPNAQQPSEPETRTRSSLADISRSDAESFSRAILAGWPSATEAFAHTKAKLFFPDNKVPRDWFLGIFRSIRGPKSPGKTPKNRN